MGDEFEPRQGPLTTRWALGHPLTGRIRCEVRRKGAGSARSRKKSP